MRKEAEKRSAVYQSIDLINATARDMDIPRGEVALKLLEREDASPITKRAALIVRAKELVKQNP